MTYNKSEIMNKAWEIKRRNIALVGKKMNDYNKCIFKTFGQCLREAWNIAKNDAKLAKMRAENQAIAAARATEPKKVIDKVVYIVPNWMMHEKALFGIRSNEIKSSDIERETTKAFKAHGEWFPKSVCERI